MKKIAIFVIFLLIFFSHILNAEQITANLLKEVNFFQTKITATQKIEASILNKKGIIHRKQSPSKNHSTSNPNVKINSKIQHIFRNIFFTTRNEQISNNKIFLTFILLNDNLASDYADYDDFILSNPYTNQDIRYWISFWKILQEKYREHRKILLEQLKDRIILIDLVSYNKEVFDKILFQNHLDLFSITMNRVGGTSLKKILSRSFIDHTRFKLIRLTTSHKHIQRKLLSNNTC